jgi:hypothetical protein
VEIIAQIAVSYMEIEILPSSFTKELIMQELKERLIRKFIAMTVGGFTTGVIAGILYVQWILE